MFDIRSMDQSVLVELINIGKLIFPSLERFLYVDSLVMIGSNIILLCLISFVGLKYFRSDNKRFYYFYISATPILLISISRIPLYDTYLTARDDGNYFLVILLNWFVNKNNPVLPFLAFGLFGSWLSTQKRKIVEKDDSVSNSKPYRFYRTWITHIPNSRRNDVRPKNRLYMVWNNCILNWFT